MDTRRVISNITFNSVDFFRSRVSSLIDDKIIEWCYWICHKPDTDDKKLHIHFVLQPSKTLSTDSLRKFFLEIDINNSLPIMPLSKWYFTTSIDDWILYGLHDVDYLRSKGLTRNVHYSIDDMQSTDRDALLHDYNNIDRSKYGRLTALSSAIRDNVPFSELVQSGVIPINYRAQYEAQFRALRRLYLKQNHIKALAHDDEFFDNYYDNKCKPEQLKIE